MIRPAKVEDLLHIEQLIKEFYDESLKDFISLDPTSIRNTILNFIDSHIVLVDDDLKGIIAGTLAYSIFDNKELFAQEHMWYVSKENRKSILGLELLSAFENKAKELKANRIIIIHMDNLNGNLMEKLYKHRGYKRMEYNFIKEVTHETLA